jgi:TfoX/Sxy family transcriptional regulator of competence genes
VGDILAAVAHDEALARRVRAALEGQDGLTEKRMFGGLAFLLDGHMAIAASSRGGIMVRVDPAREDELLTRPGAEPMIMRGRPMTGWLRVAAEELGDDAALDAWVGEGVGYVRSLPPK